MSQKDKGYASEIKEFAAKEARGVAVDDFLGANEWKSSKLMWLTGLSAFKNILSSAGNLLGGMKSRIVLLFTMAFGLSGKEVQPLPTDSIDTGERFGVAMSMYGMTDEKLRTGQKNLYRHTLFYSVLLILMTAFGVASFKFFPTERPMIFELMNRFFLVPVLFAFAVKAAFYNWQFRTRRLGSLSEFSLSPDSWWPESPSDGDNGSSSGGGKSRPRGRKLTSGAVASLVIAMIVGLLPHAAYAQAFTDDVTKEIDTILGTVPTTDLWRLMLEHIFPGIGPLEGGSGSPVNQGIAGAFEAFISVLMAVAAMGLTYHSFVGMVNTAHEGKVLGDKWHQIWAPVRVSVGFGMLAPVVKGYGVAQLLAIQIALWGGALGNTVWYAFVDNLSVAEISAPKLRETIPLVRDMVLIEACYATLKEMDEARADIGSNYGAPDVILNNTLVPATYPVGKDVGAFRTYYVWNYGACGYIKGEFSTASDSSDAAEETFENAKMEAFETLRAEMRTIGEVAASRVTTNGATATNEEIRAAIERGLDAKNAFDSALNAAGQAFVDSYNDRGMDVFKQEAKARGWASAGVFYLNISNMNASVKSAIGDLPNATFNGLAKISDEQVMSRLASDTSGVIPLLLEQWDAQIKATSKIDINSATAGQPEEQSWVHDVLEWFSNLIVGGMIEFVEIEPGDGAALQHMIDFGHTILNIFWIIFFALVAAGAVSAVKGLGFATKILDFVAGSNGTSGLASLGAAFMTMMMLLLLGIFAIGVIHAYVLPLIPFIQFTFFIMGMLILSVEAVIAAPLWAFFHIRMDGAEFVDQVQKPGYMILFNMVLRIPMAIMGLFFSVLVFEAMMFFMHKTFYPAFKVISAGNTTGLIAMIVMMGILTYLHYQLALRSFQMITQVPDRVSRWFGQGGENLGEDQETKQSTALVVGEVRSGVNSVAAKGGQAAGIRSSFGEEPKTDDGGKDNSTDAAKTGRETAQSDTGASSPTPSRTER